MKIIAKSLLSIMLVASVVGAPLALAQKKPNQSSSKASPKIYCWDEGGHRTCGDALPPSVVNAAHTEVSGQTGLATKTVDRALTPEELKAQQAQDAINQAKNQEKQKTLQYVQSLLISYPTEDALNKAFDEQDKAMTAKIDTAKKSVTTLQSILTTNLMYLADQENLKKPIPPKRTQSLKDTHTQMLDQKSLMVRATKEQLAFRAQRPEIIQVYRSLRGAPAGPAPQVSQAPASK